MTAYYYPLWRKQYFFHPMGLKDDTLLSIYHPYSPLTKLAWFGWKNNWLIRKLSMLKHHNIPFDFSILEHIIDQHENYNWVLNIGTHTSERCTTLLLKNKYCPTDLLFVKIGLTEESRKMVRNEIAILNNLSGKSVAPQIKAYGEYRNYTFLVNTAFEGRKVRSYELNETVFSMIMTLTSMHPVEYRKDGMLYAFSHGDFCPWNMLEENNILKLVDWEMAGMHLLGFDLFTYIFKTNFLLFPNKKYSCLIAQNKAMIDEFFSHYGVHHWEPYLQAFAKTMYIDCINEKNLNKNFGILIKSFQQS